MLFICYPKCTTCQKARKWLDQQGVSYTLKGHQRGPPHPGRAERVVEGQRTAAEKFFKYLRAAV